AALAVRGVALGDGVHLTHFHPAGGADGFVGINVELERCVGENDGPDVAAFHDDVRAPEVVTLEADESLSHFRDGGNGGDVGVDGLGAQFVAGVNAVHGDGGADAVVAAFEGCAVEH